MKVIAFLLLMVAIFLTIPGVSKAALWVGVQGGPNFVTDTTVKSDGTPKAVALKEVKTNTSFLGGLTFGYDFVKEGFLGYNWPNWMKYFSVAVDLTYNDFTQPPQQVRLQKSRFATPTTPSTITVHNTGHGYFLQLSLLVMVRYGFFPSPELPFGRLIPYVGVGPGAFFSVVETSRSDFYAKSSDCLDPGILTEAGIRYMVLPKVSVDAAFRYRHVFPSYDRAYYTDIGAFRGVGRIVVDQFNALFRVSYHF